jgi:hypothetical protein
MDQDAAAPDTPAADEPRDGAGRFRPGSTGNPRGRPRRDPAQAALLALLARARADGGKVTVTFDLPRAA